jgi:hypothetical protein
MLSLVMLSVVCHLIVMLSVIMLIVVTLYDMCAITVV